MRHEKLSCLLKLCYFSLMGMYNLPISFRCRTKISFFVSLMDISCYFIFCFIPISDNKLVWSRFQSVRKKQANIFFSCTHFCFCVCLLLLLLLFSFPFFLTPYPTCLLTVQVQSNSPHQWKMTNSLHFSFVPYDDLHTLRCLKSLSCHMPLSLLLSGNLLDCGIVHRGASLIQRVSLGA